MPQLDRAHLDVPGYGRLAYVQAGAGPDVLLIHGALATLEEMMLALGPHLWDRFRVTALDRPGHGESQPNSAAGAIWLQAEAARGLAHALDLRRPILIGHSFGGTVALAYALQFPDEIGGVAAVAPIAFPELRLEHALFAPRGVPGGEALNRMLSPTLDPLLLPAIWRAMFAPQEMPARFAELFPFALAGRPGQVRSVGQDAALLVPGLTRNAMNYWSCRVPVRIFGGDQDRVVNNALHGRLAARILPGGAFESLPGLGHMAHHFAQAPIVRAAEALAQAA